MKKDSQPQILENQTELFTNNIAVLLKIRPDVNYKFNDNGKYFSYSTDGKIKGKNKIDEFEETQKLLRALNSSIILNCFSLFEASFEWKLLQEVNTKNLSGIQEKVMLKYIDRIIKLSNIDSYKKEYKFLTGHNIKDMYNENSDIFLTIEKFYVIRHLLAHGSSTRLVLLPEKNGGRIRLDVEDSEYQKFVSFVKKKLNLELSNIHLNLNILLIINDIANLLVESVFSFTKKINKNKSMKFVKDNIFKVSS